MQLLSVAPCKYLYKSRIVLFSHDSGVPELVRQFWAFSSGLGRVVCRGRAQVCQCRRRRRYAASSLERNRTHLQKLSFAPPLIVDTNSNYLHL